MQLRRLLQICSILSIIALGGVLITNLMANTVRAEGEYTDINLEPAQSLVLDRNNGFDAVIFSSTADQQTKEKKFTYEVSENSINWQNKKLIELTDIVGDDFDDSRDGAGDTAERREGRIENFINRYRFLKITNTGSGNLGLRVYFLNTRSADFSTQAGETFKYGGLNIVSRQGWGCKTMDGGNDSGSPYYCDGPFWDPDYAPTTHVTIHHTATSNTSSDWASVVRAIWYNHSHVRDADPDDGVQGWTDIGYHYLIDPNGVIYEGRYGEQLAADNENVRAGHTLDHNVGNIGIALLGTYTDQNISAAAKTSLENLLQVIINDKEINPFENKQDSTGLVKRVVSGHRDWSATACPGQKLYDTIANLNVIASYPGDVKPVYRFLNKEQKIHFYTASLTEKNSVNNNLGAAWQYEGVAYRSSAISNDTTRNVYRFLNKKLKIHFYTASEAEKNNVIQKLSSEWEYEGVVFKAYKSGTLGTRPVYRFLNKKSKVHFYTASETEKNSVQQKFPDDWQFEGIAYNAK